MERDPRHSSGLLRGRVDSGQCGSDSSRESLDHGRGMIDRRQDAMAQRPVFRLAEAVLLFLFLLLPMMLLLGAAEGTAGRPTLVFWVMWLLPLLVLPWLWNRRNP